MQLFDPLSGSAPLSVSIFALYVREFLESNDILQNVWIHGEVSNCKTYPSGHCYFTLKEGDAQLLCVFFKSARQRTGAPSLRDGMALAVNGRVSFYERDGKLQFYVDAVEPLGEGALFQRFEQLKARLIAEGLFDTERKRPLPAQPAVLGIVTSLQAAALRDMLRVLRLRYPLVRVLLAPALVQGADAPDSIAAAIDLLNEQGEAEVIIVGRGGGSIEELWAFNEEVVARAIARSRIPIISGVGHETDFTIADFVADHRASTPTAAATAAVPDLAAWRADLIEKQEQLVDLMQERLLDLHGQMAYAQRDLQRLSPQSLIERRRQQLDEASERLHTQMSHLQNLRKERLRGIALQLHSLSPLLTIARGYAVVRREEDQQIITSVQQVQTGEKLIVQVQDGQLAVRVEP
ncbi:exodeoxyribonuclease VII large subunit [Tengunoibacter tsumagoiensis]|uniref:Exodeoxyribonuclease 7 large subunit n=1 Tax=Tengunoibacter tsumagoiensis TaxID=2014871 RepID=A0A401ZY10_9CHLR|nr:exodeoxyribonuclease VII large subunit [Tengunoibacter tsumagoiensis]GCE11729.1 exodeoxyribonuclease 7 large subunit [Tengunoibacter tsumagoiensis]